MPGDADEPAHSKKKRRRTTREPSLTHRSIHGSPRARRLSASAAEDPPPTRTDRRRYVERGDEEQLTSIRKQDADRPPPTHTHCRRNEMITESLPPIWTDCCGCMERGDEERSSDLIRSQVGESPTIGRGYESLSASAAHAHAQMLLAHARWWIDYEHPRGRRRSSIMDVILDAKSEPTPPCTHCCDQGRAQLVVADDKARFPESTERSTVTWRASLDGDKDPGPVEAATSLHSN